METDEKEGMEGLSRPKKVAAGAALGVAIPAAVAVAKKLIADDGDASKDADAPTSREARGQQRSKSRPSASRKTASRKTATRKTATRKTAARKTTARKTTTRTRTREQLYKQAARLGVEGRSGMTKAELERAVERVKRRKASSR